MDRLVILPIDAPTCVNYRSQPKATRIWRELWHYKKCYHYGQKSHFANVCPNSWYCPDVTTVDTSTPNRQVNSTVSTIQQQFQQRPHPTKEQGYAAPQRQMIKPMSNLQTPTTGNQNMQMMQATPNTTKDPVKRRCFNYGEKDHCAHLCPKLRPHPNRMPSTNPSPNRGVNSVFMTTRHNLARGRVNQVVAP
jgi:hypothetical protein